MLAASSSARPGSPRALSALLSCSTASPFTGSSPRLLVPLSPVNVTRLSLSSASCSDHPLPPTHLFCLPCHLCLYSEHKGPGEGIPLPPPGEPAPASTASVLGTVALPSFVGLVGLALGPSWGSTHPSDASPPHLLVAITVATPGAHPEGLPQGLPPLQACAPSVSGPPWAGLPLPVPRVSGGTCPLHAPSTPYPLPCSDSSALLFCSWPAFSNYLRGFQESKWLSLLPGSAVPWKEEAPTQRHSPLLESSNRP